MALGNIAAPEYVPPVVVTDLTISSEFGGEIEQTLSIPRRTSLNIVTNSSGDRAVVKPEGQSRYQISQMDGVISP